jgi:hypothetical protein
MKHCSICKQEKPFEAYHNSSSIKSGYVARCKVCEAERAKAKYERRREAQLAKAKIWRSERKDVYQAAIFAWRERNPGRHEQLMKDWAARNPDKVNAKWMKRDAAKKNRTPSWLTDDELWMMEQAYDIASLRTKILGVPFHVDHIVPLQGKTVSGLHVPWNLQVIPAKLNQQKSNRF